MIKPRIVSGFRDYLPEVMLPRQRLIATIRSVFEEYGFPPLDTPAMEVKEILTDKYGEEGDFQIYRLKDREEKDLALRFDLTVPLARLYAMYFKELTRPFKRYHIAPVWRADKPRPGRFREFVQCDADTVGTRSMAADAEMLLMMRAFFEGLGIKRYVIRLNSRKVLNGLLDVFGIKAEHHLPVLRVLDKYEKAGRNAVLAELCRTEWPEGTSEEETSGICLGLHQEVAEGILAFTTLPFTDEYSNAKGLEEGRKLLQKSEEGSAGINELERVLTLLAKSSGRQEVFRLDFSVARGLDYYTGPIYETNLLDLPDYGSVCSGGRYDGLIGRFMKEEIPAVGTSVGLDRLLAAMEALKLVESRRSTTQVLVTVFEDGLYEEAFAIAGELRQAGYATETFLGDSKSLKKQFTYADRLGIPLTVIFGPDELTRGEVALKDMTKALGDESKQWTIQRKRVVEEVKAFFGR